MVGGNGGARASAATSAILQNIVHKFVGARWMPGLFGEQQEYPPASKSNNFGRTYETPHVIREIASHKIVFLGEVHSQPPIIAMQRAVVSEMRRQQQQQQQQQQEGNAGAPFRVHVVMEHFSFPMQGLLDQYQQHNGENTRKSAFQNLLTKYREIGTEGHALEPYQELLDVAIEGNFNDCGGGSSSSSSNHQNQNAAKIKFQAGFLSKPFARLIMKEGMERVLQEAGQWLPSRDQLELSLIGSDLHYNVFEGLITGRSVTSLEPGPDDRLRGIFRAQLLKDAAMANRIHKILVEGDENDRIVVVAGNGHLLHYCGVPERVLALHPELVNNTCLVIGKGCPPESLENDESIREALEYDYPKGSNPADYVYLYAEEEDDDDDEEEDDERETAVKKETRLAYDRVGESAHLPGNRSRARTIMSAMGYTEEQIDVAAGSEIHNFQGVGNPHLHAQIRKGDRVLDVGSGLGVDSFIAANAAGTDGSVLGVDLSPAQVRHARQIAERRGLEDRIQFVTAEMDRLTMIPDNSIDVAISNGAFCLAPNKEKALAEIFRVLKPGGRISVCTTTTKVDNLEEGVNWPLCMKMFMPKRTVQSMCQKIGYVNVIVDDSDSSMTMELPEEIADGGKLNPERNRVHGGGGAEYDHLEERDMDKLCARVCIVAEKPMARSAGGGAP